MLKKTILIAEDDQTLGQMYKTAFEKEGFGIILAIDGEDVFIKLKDQIPDLITLDIDMPKKNGLEVLKELKQDKKYQNIPVVMLTNHSRAEDMKECHRLGANEYAVKSNWPISEMIEWLKILFKE